MKITFQSPPKNIDEKMITNILRDYKLLNCEVLIRDENGIPFDILSRRIQSANKAACSHGRRLDRRDHERPPKIHPMVIF